MIRFAVTAIRNLLLILGIVLASCFIGRGANVRMKHVIGLQQRYVARRDRRLNRW